MDKIVKLTDKNWARNANYMLTNCLVTSLFVKPTDQATHEQQTSKQTVVRRSGLTTDLVRPHIPLRVQCCDTLQD